MPDDDSALGDDLRRHGVRPGQRLHVAVVGTENAETKDEELPAFFSSFDGPPDLGARVKDILRAELPRAR